MNIIDYLMTIKNVYNQKGGNMNIVEYLTSALLPYSLFGQQLTASLRLAVCYSYEWHGNGYYLWLKD